MVEKTDQKTYLVMANLARFAARLDLPVNLSLLTSSRYGFKICSVDFSGSLFDGNVGHSVVNVIDLAHSPYELSSVRSLSTRDPGFMEGSEIRPCIGSLTAARAVIELGVSCGSSHGFDQHRGGNSAPNITSFVKLPPHRTTFNTVCTADHKLMLTKP